jgi:hypothetical protein
MVLMVSCNRGWCSSRHWQAAANAPMYDDCYCLLLAVVLLVLQLRGYRRVFAHTADIFFVRGIARPDTVSSQPYSCSLLIRNRTQRCTCRTAPHSAGLCPGVFGGACPAGVGAGRATLRTAIDAEAYQREMNHRHNSHAHSKLAVPGGQINRLLPCQL